MTSAKVSSKELKLYNDLGDLQFLWGLGLREDEAECCDVYGLDEELLEMVPKPVLAVLFLYPITTQLLELDPLDDNLERYT
ncbi:hypothetical protein JHK82_028006 [Glycine max]|nr:hypothetical protein JHK85_028660 [Glycine max]KAG5003985.1 hypothetical protein JHK86_028124 [Glycine max]KAG5127171.1 hypothetical protein JHK82_028006 [Glycine max]KAG5151777.1 hypothetical protein JHK84_028249 [Glycine max]